MLQHFATNIPERSRHQDLYSMMLTQVSSTDALFSPSETGCLMAKDDGRWPNPEPEVLVHVKCNPNMVESIFFYYMILCILYIVYHDISIWFVMFHCFTT